MCLTIGIGVAFCAGYAADVSIGIIGVVIGSLGVYFLGELPLGIVGIGGSLVCPGSPAPEREPNCPDLDCVSNGKDLRVIMHQYMHHPLLLCLRS